MHFIYMSILLYVYNLCFKFDDIFKLKKKVVDFCSDYRISPSISREIYPRTKYYTDNSSYTRVTPSGKKLYQKQVEFSKFGRNMTEQW